MSAAWVLVGAAWLGWGWRTLGHMQELEVRRHWYCAALYCTILYCTVLYCTLLYCTHISGLPGCTLQSPVSEEHCTHSRPAA